MAKETTTPNVVFRNIALLDQITGVDYGFSHASFGNMSSKWGGESAIVNKRRFGQAVGLDFTGEIIMPGSHDKKITVVGSRQKGAVIYGVDGLITTDRDIILSLHAADCSPIIFTNTGSEFLALIHAGFKGTDLGICQTAVGLLGESGFKPEELIVGIGPTATCYEGEYIRSFQPDSWFDHLQVADMARAIITPHNDIFEVRHPNNYPMWIDLVGYTTEQLIAVGVAPEHIEFSGLCTVCETRRGNLFSHQVSREDSVPEARYLAYAYLR